MLDHHLQKQMLYTLVTSESARFADIRPKTVDSNVATYHLRQLVKQGFVEKRANGRYYLTPEGKIAGTTITLGRKESLSQAHSVFFLALQNDKGAWLLRKRLAQPMYGKSGFVHGEPIAMEPIAETAQKILKEKTGLSATFSPRGSGYVTLLEGKAHQSFIHFTLLVGNDIKGKLIERVGNGENYWYDGDFSEDFLIPSMKPLIDKLGSPEQFFTELTYQIEPL
jgi:hypothetical protein